MQGLFKNEGEALPESTRASAAVSWPTRVLGFIGSAIIFWIGLRFLAPVLVSAWGVIWIDRPWVKIGIACVAAPAMAALLSRIEGTIWGKYYVIIGYLLSLGLIVWLVLRLLHYL
jgi:hypothetical protein